MLNKMLNLQNRLIFLCLVYFACLLFAITYFRVKVRLCRYGATAVLHRKRFLFVRLSLMSYCARAFVLLCRGYDYVEYAE